MKKLLLIVCILASSISYCQNLVSIEWYNMDTIKYNSIDKFKFYGDSAIIKITLSYSAPADLNKVVTLDILGKTIYQGTVTDYLEKSGWIKIKFPVLPYYQIGNNKYSYPFNFNGSVKSYLQIFPKEIIPDRKIELEYISSETVYLGDSAYVAIKFSSVGQWVSNDLLYVTIQNNGNTTVYNNSILDLDKIKRNSDSTTWLKFKIPNSLSLGEHTYLIEVTGNSLYTCPTKPFFNVKSLVTSISSPSESNQLKKIKFYTIFGLEIEKPNDGLYIWKAETGESGKVLISQF